MYRDHGKCNQCGKTGRVTYYVHRNGDKGWYCDYHLKMHSHADARSAALESVSGRDFHTESMSEEERD